MELAPSKYNYRYIKFAEDKKSIIMRGINMPPVALDAESAEGIASTLAAVPTQTIATLIDEDKYYANFTNGGLQLNISNFQYNVSELFFTIANNGLTFQEEVKIISVVNTNTTPPQYLNMDEIITTLGLPQDFVFSVKTMVFIGAFLKKVNVTKDDMRNARPDLIPGY